MPPPPPPPPSSEPRVRELQTFPLPPDLPLLRRIDRKAKVPPAPWTLRTTPSPRKLSATSVVNLTRKNTFQSISVCKVLYLYLYLYLCFIIYRNTERFCILYFILIDHKYMYILCINICVLFLNLAGPCLSCLFENNIKSKLDKNGNS